MPGNRLSPTCHFSKAKWVAAAQPSVFEGERPVGVKAAGVGTQTRELMEGPMEGPRPSQRPSYWREVIKRAPNDGAGLALKLEYLLPSAPEHGRDSHSGRRSDPHRGSNRGYHSFSRTADGELFHSPSRAAAAAVAVAFRRWVYEENLDSTAHLTNPPHLNAHWKGHASCQ